MGAVDAAGVCGWGRLVEDEVANVGRAEGERPCSDRNGTLRGGGAGPCQGGGANQKLRVFV